MNAVSGGPGVKVELSIADIVVVMAMVVVSVIPNHFRSLLPPPEFLALKHESRILGHSSNIVCGFSMMEQVRLCVVWAMENELAWLFLEPDTGLDH